MRNAVGTTKIICSLPFQRVLAGVTFVSNIIIIQGKREHWWSSEGEKFPGKEKEGIKEGFAEEVLVN